jgi:hypothetical protein
VKNSRRSEAKNELLMAASASENYLEKLIRADNLKPILDRINIIRIEHKHAAKSLKSEEREREKFLPISRIIGELFTATSRRGLSTATHAKWLNHNIISLLIDGSKPSTAFWHSFFCRVVRRKGIERRFLWRFRGRPNEIHLIKFGSVF